LRPPRKIAFRAAGFNLWNFAGARLLPLQLNSTG